MAFNDFNLKQISGVTSKKNKASQSLLLKMGLVFEKYINLPNKNEKVMIFKLIQPEKKD